MSNFQPPFEATFFPPFFGVTIPEGDGKPTFDLPFFGGSAIPIRGPDPIFARETTATVPEYQNGLLKRSRISEIRLSGMRRVESLIQNSEDISLSPWSVNGTAGVIAPDQLSLPAVNDSLEQGLLGTGGLEVKGRSYTSRVDLADSGTITLRIVRVSGDFDKTDKTVTLGGTAAPYSVSHGFTLDSVGVKLQVRRVSGDTPGPVTVQQAMAEETTGQVVTAPSEYVMAGVLGDPWQGVNVDGVKYFTTLNGNTVGAGGDVVEAAGTEIPLAERRGYLSEKLSTNVCANHNLRPTDTSGLTKTGDAAATLSLDVGTVGYPDALKALGNGDTILLDNSLGVADAYVTIDGQTGSTEDFSATVWVKTDGTGRISYDDLATPITFTNAAFSDNKDWRGRAAPASTSKLTIHATAGSKVWFIGNLLEESPFQTSLIEVAGVAESRAADRLEYDNSSRQYLRNSFTIVLETEHIASGTEYEAAEMVMVGSEDSRGADYELRTLWAGAAYLYVHKVGGGVLSIRRGDIVAARTRYAFTLNQESAGQIRAIIYRNGVEKYNNLVVGTLDHSNLLLTIGYWSSFIYSGTTKWVKIYKGALGTAQYEYLTDLDTVVGLDFSLPSNSQCLLLL